jgi:hypothetical protein
MKAKFGSKSRTARLAVVLAAVLVLSLTTAATAMANPAIYWGQINTASYVPHGYFTVGSDCTGAIGSHDNQSLYPPNGDAQAAATFVCNGSLRHDVQIRVIYWVLVNGQWYNMTDTGWYHYANTLYGMGKTNTLMTQPVCANNVPAGSTWRPEVYLYVDGVSHTYYVQGAWPSGPNHC